jgi:GNAT superfamily N-acetyltransferase
MIDMERVIACEVNYPRGFSNVVETEYGLLYHNLENPLSHDSNHAVVLRLDVDVAEVVNDIMAFYQVRGLAPRLYTAYRPGEMEKLGPALAAMGFRFIEDPMRLFVQERDSTIRPAPEVAVRRARSLDKGILALVNSERDEPWSVGVLERQVSRKAFHLYVVYVRDQAVSMASVNLMDGLSEVCDVVTHFRHRGKGYARALMAGVVGEYARISANPLYLWASNPTAIRIYEEAGFVEQTCALRNWSAYLPQEGATQDGETT